MLIDKAALSVRHCAASEEMRHGMPVTGVYFESNRTVATNGHMLVIVKASDLPAVDFPIIDGLTSEPARAENRDQLPLVPFTISSDAADQLAKSLPKKSNHAIIKTALLDEVKSRENGKAYFGVTDLDTRNVLEFKKLDGHFPDVDKVIDHSKPVASITLNADYIAALAKVARECGDVKSSLPVSLTFELHDLEGQKQVRITSSASDRFEAVLMPLRK